MLRNPVTASVAEMEHDMTKISPSLLACDFSRIGQEVSDIERAGAEYLHLDVMDGVFVPNMSFGFPIIEAIKGKTKMVLDVHLMITEPGRYIKETAAAGADIITVHLEACRDVAATLRAIREAGVRAALSVKPNTPVEAVYPYLELTDMILIMTVEPGYGGQKLIPETIEKVRILRRELDLRSLSVEIEVDGGITPENAGTLVEAGADVLVAGSSVFRAADRAAAVAALRA